MTLDEAQIERAKPVEKDEEGTYWVPYLIREGRPGMSLYDYHTYRFWTTGIVLSGLPPEDQRVPFTPEDEGADDWGIYLYPC